MYWPLAVLFYLADTHQGIVCYAYYPFARVAVDGRESVELVYVCVSQPRFLEKFALCTLLSRLVDIQKTSRESPMSLERVGSSFNQEYVKAQAVISEHHTVGRNRWMGILITILQLAHVKIILLCKFHAAKLAPISDMAKNYCVKFTHLTLFNRIKGQRIGL